MKKFMLIFVVLTVVFAGCASPVDEVEVEPVNPFEGVWQSVETGYITIRRGNQITDSSGSLLATFKYDDTYYYRYELGNLSHIYITYRYEFKENGTMLYLYWVPNVYGTIDDDIILQKIGD